MPRPWTTPGRSCCGPAPAAAAAAGRRRTGWPSSDATSEGDAADGEEVEDALDDLSPRQDRRFEDMWERASHDSNDYG